MSFSSEEHLINPAQLSSAFNALRRLPTEKRAFVPGGDPSMGGDPSGGGAPPPGGDPSGGGMPPGGDPSMGGGAPPPGGGAGGDGGLMQMVTSMQQQIQQMQQGGGMGMQAGAGGGAGKNPLTPKIDEKAVMLQILKILARIADFLKVPIPATEMVVNQNDMTQLAQASSAGGPMPGMDPSVGGGGGPQPMPGAGAPGGMPPPGPEKMGHDRRQTKKAEDGFAFDTSRLAGISNRAAAIARIQRTRAAA